MLTLLAFSGSSRAGSLNALLLERAEIMAAAAGATVETIDLRELDLPIYDGDYEAANGLPQGARDLKEAMREADGFLIASPEYNSHPTPLLINSLAWASRKGGGDDVPLSAFKGKVAGLMAASPGALGGLRSLWALRAMLQNVGVVVAPTLAAVGGANEDLFQEETFDPSSNGRRLHSMVQETLSLLS
ncbi:MAG: NAD(P)H-dependent oxidoreductase [Verrucomicrobia bacterium]|nr:NAD(P)H-dependent oxidoreductase [Verrucomicrobiota bacterium]MCH8511433.1 NAD(P)H-dependent oxidoreductase [Kiritimatiellia bacterium]